MSSLIKTILLFTFLTLLLVFIGRLIGGTGGMLFFLFIATIINGISYFFSDKIALSMSHAQPIKESDDPKLFSIIRDLAQRADMPMPRVYMTPDMQPNAFATGRSPKHAAVAVTRGIMQILTYDELKGVLAHEMSHVRNRDVLIATIAAVLVGVISFIAQMAGFFGGGDRENSNPFAGLIMLILAPLGATLIQLAISRQREYQADASGAHLIHDPMELATALQKIEYGVKTTPMDVNQSLSSLYIANPFSGNLISSLFSTHPPMDKRIERLRLMKGKV